MTTLESLLGQCKLEPGDDDSRLVLSDFLDDEGRDDLAEFVRLQLTRHRHQFEWQPDEVVREVRETRLFDRLASKWCGGAPINRWWFQIDPNTKVKRATAYAKFDRGTITLRGTAEKTSAALDRLPAEVLPWVERLELENWDHPHRVRRLLDKPQSAECSALVVSWKWPPPLDLVDHLDQTRWSQLGIRSNTRSSALLERLAQARQLRPHLMQIPTDPHSEAGWSALLGSEVMSELRDLSFSFHRGVGVPSLQRLARAPHLHKLRRLFLSGNEYPIDALRQLMTSPVVENLQSLTIFGWFGTTHNVAQSLADETSLDNLTRLDIGGNDLHTADGELLARSNALEKLRYLNLRRASLTNRAFEAIVTSPRLGPVEYLDLSYSQLGDSGVVALAGSPRVKHLRHLDLSGCNITSTAIEAIAKSPHLASLESLVLRGDPENSAGFEAIGASPHIGNLLNLQVFHTNITAENLARFLESPVARYLQRFSIHIPDMTREHARIFSEAIRPDHLQEFSLHASNSNHDAIEPLLSAGWLDRLSSLTLSGVGLTDSGVATLTRTLRSGNLGVLHLDQNRLTSRGAQTLLDWPGLRALHTFEFYLNRLDDEWKGRLELAIWPVRN